MNFGSLMGPFLVQACLVATFPEFGVPTLLKKRKKTSNMDTEAWFTLW